MANYIYNLPFFKNSSNSFLKQVLGGWSVSGITSFLPAAIAIDFSCGVSGFSNGMGEGYRCNTVGNLQVAERDHERSSIRAHT